MTYALATWIARRAAPPGTAMLMYHAITTGGATPAWPWAVSQAAFRNHLDLIAAAGWHTATVRQLAEQALPPDRPTVVITFDDGFANNLAAVEELVKRRMCATWFVVTGSIGRSPDWDANGQPDGRLLSAAELRGMHGAGMEIGSHTVSHQRLTTLDAECVERELRNSRNKLEDLLGQPVTSFAYPYGDHSVDVVAAVQQAGYLAACTTRTGWAMRDGDPLRLRRLTVFNRDSTSTLARKLYFGSHDVGWPAIGRYFARRVAARFGAP